MVLTTTCAPVFSGQLEIRAGIKRDSFINGLDLMHHEMDLRDRGGIDELVKQVRPSAIVHCAAQPSHDLAASRPFDDFDVNAVGTLNLLEAARQFCRETPFVHMSTNKVYGDAPNEISARRVGNLLGLRRPYLFRRYSRKLSHRPEQALAYSALPSWLPISWSRNMGATSVCPHAVFVEVV